jgi:signal peptidase I
MNPTLRAGDGLYVDPRAYRNHPPTRGDIVIARDPALPSRHLVKRVGGVPGDPVSHDGTTVPPGTILLLGDAPERSRDSREFGPVPLGSIVGRAYRCYRPVERRRTL